MSEYIAVVCATSYFYLLHSIMCKCRIVCIWKSNSSTRIIMFADPEENKQRPQESFHGGQTTGT